MVAGVMKALEPTARRERKARRNIVLRLVVVEKIGELLDLWSLIVDGKIL